MSNLNFLAPSKKNKEQFKQDAQDKITNRFYKLESGINEDDNDNDNLEHLEEVTKNILEEEKRQLENINKTNNIVNNTTNDLNNKTTTE